MAERTPPNDASAAKKRPNYALRRVGALGVLGVIGYSLVRVVGSAFGGDDNTSEALVVVGDSVVDTEASGDNDVVDTDPVDERGDGSDTDSASIDCSSDDQGELCQELGLVDGATVDEGSAAPDGDVESSVPGAESDDGESESAGPPTSANPAKVYIVGDSDAGTFGPYLQTLLGGTLVTETELNYKVSSGLARPDFFDWPAELRTKLPEVDPDIVVVTFGGNDSQGLSAFQDELEFVIGDPLQNEAEWSEEYQRRAGEVMDILLENDRHVIWVGIPNDDNPEVTAKLAIQDRAAKAAAAERPEVVFVDTWARFSGRSGGWAEFVVDPRDNVGKDVRAADGFHLNQNGAEILAIDIAIEVQNELREMGAAL
ncbi:MAG: DUF459 domain-containing protein [Ilumatobacter sp.]